MVVACLVWRLQVSKCPLIMIIKVHTNSPGDGRQFPRNPRTDEVLGRLAGELAQAEVARRS